MVRTSQIGLTFGLLIVPGLAAVPLDWGKAFQSSDVNSWPDVAVPYGCGTDTNIPQLPNMLDKTLHVTIDLSKAGCRNVLAFQAVDASVNNGCYCDGNSLSARDDDPYSPGNCKGPLNQNHQPCVELDFLESNKYVWGTTIHASAVPGGWQGGTGAGRGGDRRGIDQWQYGPGSSVINTNSPFDVSIGFPTSGGSLQGINITMSQAGQSVLFVTGAGMNLYEAHDAIQRGVTPGFSYWRFADGGASWYDLNDCSDDQGEGGTAYFTNWAVTDGTDPVPPPSPPPAPTPSDCPGGSLSACIAECPESPASVYQVCVDVCLDRCGSSPPAPPTPPPTPASRYTLHSGANCYQGMGSTDLEPDGQCSTRSLDACKTLCDQTSGCQGVTVAAAGGSDVKCCRRGDVQISQCVQNDQYYSTWTKDGRIHI